MNQKDKAKILLNQVQKSFPDAQTELTNWKTPFQFLICIILSSQTTDIQVNKVTEKLFKVYPTPEALSQANIEDVVEILSSINYKNIKSKHIIETAKILVTDYKSDVPRSLTELMKLKGVGYKVANVFLNGLYKENQGIAVDTHVARVAQRFGLTKEEDPFKIAKDLEKLLPKTEWYKVNSSIVLFGRYICTAKSPKCTECPVSEYCPSRRE